LNPDSIGRDGGTPSRLIHWRFLPYNTGIVTLIIPDERFGNLKLDERDLMTDIAIGLYKREQVSLGRAAEIAGVSSPQFLSELGRRRIPINYDVDDLHADIATLGNVG
jgi:predicted HTH domain antitoxin